MMNNGMGIHGSKEHWLDIERTLKSFKTGKKKGQ